MPLSLRNAAIPRIRHRQLSLAGCTPGLSVKQPTQPPHKLSDNLNQFQHWSDNNFHNLHLTISAYPYAHWHTLSRLLGDGRFWNNARRSVFRRMRTLRLHAAVAITRRICCRTSCRTLFTTPFAQQQYQRQHHHHPSGILFTQFASRQTQFQNMYIRISRVCA